MLINIEHPKYRGIELKGKTLQLHLSGGGSELLQDDVEDFAAAIQGESIQIAAFLENRQYAWHFWGKRELNRSHLELGQICRGGARLVIDGAGRIHLFYFCGDQPSRGALLKHQIFDGEWSTPLTVSASVWAQRSGFSAAWHEDQYLHAAYCSHRGQQLYYRVFDLEHSVWSGAVSFSEKSCLNPQLIPAQRLYLFWQEKNEKDSLKVRYKENVWSEGETLSSKEEHADGLGYGFEGGEWFVYWRQGTKLYKAPFRRWNEAKEVEEGRYNYIWFAQQGITIPCYQAIQAALPEAESLEAVPQAPQQQEPSPALDSLREQQEEMAAKLQGLEKGWRGMQREMENWRAPLAAWGKTDPVLLASGCERLERRFASFRQSREQQARHWETQMEEIRLMVSKNSRRLHDLELMEKKRQESLWRRLLQRKH